MAVNVTTWVPKFVGSADQRSGAEELENLSRIVGLVRKLESGAAAFSPRESGTSIFFLTLTKHID